jgi:glycosyltransferase involved in cell wall biosynthesis
MTARASSPITVVVPLPPSYRGGTEEYAYRLVQRVSHQYPVQVYTTNVRWDPRAPCLETGRAQVTRLPAAEIFQRPFLRSPWARMRLAMGIERSQLLHVHMPFPLVENSATRNATDCGIPTVLTYHMDADLQGATGSPTADVVTWTYRRMSAAPALQRADVIVSNSRGYAEQSPVLSRHLSKVRVIHKGIDPVRLQLPAPPGDRHRPASVPSEFAPERRRRLVFVGRLVPYKGVSVLLEATRRLRDWGEDVVLFIAGHGPLEVELREQTRVLGLNDRVCFLGFVPDDEIGPLYRYADVVVAPSVGMLESTPTTLEEAAACGTPVVGSDLPGAAETVPHDGRRGALCPPNDPEALARAIVRVLGHGRPDPPTHLRTWDDTAREYLELFDTLGARVPTGETNPPERHSVRSRFALPMAPALAGDSPVTGVPPIYLAPVARASVETATPGRSRRRNGTSSEGRAN